MCNILWCRHIFALKIMQKYVPNYMSAQRQDIGSFYKAPIEKE